MNNITDADTDISIDTLIDTGRDTDRKNKCTSWKTTIKHNERGREKNYLMG